jgi:hypothetical protein
LATIAQIVGRIVWPHVPQGFSTVIVVCLFLGAIQLLSISFLAEYIGKIFEEVKQRPTFIVTKLLNFQERAASDGAATTVGPTPSGPGQGAPKA